MQRKEDMVNQVLIATVNAIEELREFYWLVDRREMTTGKINIWRHDVYRATREALHQRRKFSEVPSRWEFFNTIRVAVARATFCAKLDDYEYSCYPRK